MYEKTVIETFLPMEFSHNPMGSLYRLLLTTEVSSNARLNLCAFFGFRREIRLREIRCGFDLP